MSNRNSLKQEVIRKTLQEKLVGFIFYLKIIKNTLILQMFIFSIFSCKIWEFFYELISQRIFQPSRNQ